MNKLCSAIFATTIVSASLLSGCQLLTGYQKIDDAENAHKVSGKIYPVANEVNIACLGTYHCEINRIDQTRVISSETHLPVDITMVTTTPNTKEVSSLRDNKSLKIVPLSASGIAGLTNYYVRAKPIKREVHVSFYPEDNLNYVERFAIIHDFTEATYQIRAYPMKSSQDTKSLLDNASPNPLCVDLIKDGSIERRFCKQAGTERQGEFVETGVFDSTES